MSRITRDCHRGCMLHQWHEHDADDESWLGPSGWFRKHPTDRVPSGYICRCGAQLLDGGETRDLLALASRCEAAEARAEDLEQQRNDAYAALEYLRSKRVHVALQWGAGGVTGPSVSTLPAQIDNVFYAALSAAIGRELTPPDLPQLFEMRRIDITRGQDPAEYLAQLYQDEIST